MKPCVACYGKNDRSIDKNLCPDCFHTDPEYRLFELLQCFSDKKEEANEAGRRVVSFINYKERKTNEQNR